MNIGREMKTADGEKTPRQDNQEAVAGAHSRLPNPNEWRFRPGVGSRPPQSRGKRIRICNEADVAEHLLLGLC